ncbi:transposase [Saccharicrinis sp. FJH2]|uniref:transposase n=1 Tax=Saccharicrinis sp. FJH65 TaxID=3344659 RepID=UPI0035F38E0B
MYFEKGHLYHVFNQGNNKQQIFFNSENYNYFLRKIRNYILPYADVLAYCLMPNHFHLMLKISDITLCKSSDDSKSSDDLSYRTLNDSIAIMLRSYTRAINKQQETSDALFRPKTKSVCLTNNEGVSPSYFNSSFGTYLNIDLPEKNYPQQCFDYIHSNPVKARLVEFPEEWEFSSYVEYKGLRKEFLVNVDVAKEEDLEW